MFELLICALATYKVTAMLIDYDGPLLIFERLREVAEKQPAKYRIFNFDCHFCLGTWVALPFALYAGNGWQEVIIYWFAISALDWFMHVVEWYFSSERYK